MEIMRWIIDILLIVLLGAAIYAVFKLISVLTDVNATLTAARQDVDATLKRVDTVLTTTETLLRDEVTPTIQVARTTLENVEVTTRALATTSVAAQKLMHQLEGVVEPAKIAQMGNVVAQFAIKRGAGMASGMLSGMASGLGNTLKSLLHRKSEENVRTAKPSDKRALPASHPKDGTSDTGEQGTVVAAPAGSKKRR